MLCSLCRWGAGAVSLWAEGSGHHPLLHLHRHRAARGGAGIHPGREHHSLSRVLLKIPQIPQGAMLKCCSGGGLGAEIMMSEPSSLGAPLDEEQRVDGGSRFLVVCLSLCSFPENQQASASLQGQTRQVQ